jgi:hypothetical protein
MGSNFHPAVPDQNPKLSYLKKKFNTSGNPTPVTTNYPHSKSPEKNRNQNSKKNSNAILTPQYITCLHSCTILDLIAYKEKHTRHFSD